MTSSSSFFFSFARSEAKLRFVDSAVGDERGLLGPAALAAEVRHPIDDVDVGDDVAEDAGELVAHVGQDDAELRGNLKRRKIILKMISSCITAVHDSFI